MNCEEKQKENIKKEIIEMVKRIESLWILNEIYRYIKNITK